MKVINEKATENSSPDGLLLAGNLHEIEQSFDVMRRENYKSTKDVGFGQTSIDT